MAQEFTVFFEAGRAALKREDHARAIEELERILERLPGNPKAQELLDRARRLTQDSDR